MKKVIFLLLVVGLYLSCSKNSTNGINNICNPNVSYSNNVKPIIARSCNISGCHDGIAVTSLADYITMHDGANQIKASILAGIMPKNGKLTALEKETIVCWIDNGAKNN